MIVLFVFGVKTLEDGSLAYDSTRIEPEVAQSWTISDDGKLFTFKINPKLSSGMVRLLQRKMLSGLLIARLVWEVSVCSDESRINDQA